MKGSERERPLAVKYFIRSARNRGDWIRIQLDSLAGAGRVCLYGSVGKPSRLDVDPVQLGCVVLKDLAQDLVRHFDGGELLFEAVARRLREREVAG